MSFLQVTKISKTHLGHPVLQHVSFQQREDQRIGIVGETGSGKSTLLKIVAGLIQTGEGSVYFNGDKIEGPEEKLMPGHPGIAYLSQYFELPNNYYVEEVLDYANKLTNEEAQNIYNLCNIDHLLKRKTSALSGGEKQRIALARILITSPKLLLLDEPYSNLDMIHKTVLKSVLTNIARQLQISTILVSHDPLDVLAWAHTILVMKEGEIVQQGAPFTIFNQPLNQYVAALFGRYNNLSPLLLHSLIFLHGDASDTANPFTRPERLQISKIAGRGVMGEVLHVLYYGSYYELEVKVLNETVIIRTTFSDFEPGNVVYVSLCAAHEAIPKY